MINFREFTTSSKKQVLAGKSAQNNEDLIAQVEPTEDVFHTEAPGSSFVNIKSTKTNKVDRYEAATFCAAFSQTFRDNQNDTIVHHFKGSDITKSKLMKLGTFKVKKFKTIKVKKADILKIKQ
jgi:predicted ribosome quality control (RQC) complex YloA/Tae2 family protein